MKVYQIWYNDESKLSINRNFIPYDNRNPNRPNEFEYGVMRKLYYDEHTWNKNKHLGVISWKFQQKTLLHPDKAMTWLNKNKGFDVYTFNPFTNMKVFDNVWQQGEHFHSGMLDFAKMMFERAGIDTNILDIPHTPKVACYCNYWVANKKFWDVYISYTEKLYKACYASEKEIQNKLFNIKADREIESGMFSFLFERMFTTVLAAHQNDFKIKPYFT